jgi:hypothetical protein
MWFLLIGAFITETNSVVSRYVFLNFVGAPIALIVKKNHDSL